MNNFPSAKSVKSTKSKDKENNIQILNLGLSFLVAIVSEIVFKVLAGNWLLISGIGRVSVVFLSLVIVQRFSLVCLRNYRPRIKDLLTLHTITIASIVLIGLSFLFVEALASYSKSFSMMNPIPASALFYAVPFATGALLIQSVLGLQYGLIFGICISIIMTVYPFSSFMIGPFVLISVFVACLSLGSLRTRSAYLRAGLRIALFLIPFAIGCAIIEDTVAFSDLSYRVLCTFFSGALCVFIAAGLTPLVEYLGGYVTDIRLIEMATLDHPLLKELSVQAPGTWNHSMVIGMMVESAASEIGANPVLSRVGAYFHDIGKMKKPLYFAENQGQSENRHDKLSPSMSALIIRSHVKDGLELGKQHKLPESILDMISQHHGSSVIEYFYDKAIKEAEETEDAKEVDISLYTYPGPKPQSKESGLLMLADGIEAATRTIKDPSLDRIQGLVQKMINKVFASGELNECDLTLRDLHQIAKCFTRVLAGIYHQRVAYAEPAEKVSEKETAKTAKENQKNNKDSNKQNQSTEKVQSNGEKRASESLERGSNHKGNNQNPNEHNKSNGDDKEDLKRLGLS